ncbi:MAG: hypothetical protein QM278_07725 [Pseudomonadota bacterium]|nr:hypothetical protein [Pseudomonadota bacterium]
MKRSFKVSVMVAVCCLLCAATVRAAEVTVVSEGASKQQAINNAMRMAIEQALGTYVESKTMVSDFKVASDHIASASAGVVKKYDIISEGKDPIEGTYKIKARVTVDDGKLKDAFQAYMNDPRAKKVFQETKFSQRRIVVVYSTEAKDDLPLDSRPVKHLMSLIEDRLVGHGFRVFLPDQLIRIRGRAALEIRDDKTAMALASQEQADAVVIVSFDAQKRGTDEGYGKLRANVLLKSYDLTTGELFCNINNPENVVTGSGGFEEAMTRIVQSVGPKSADDLTAKIVERFSTVRQNFVYLVFKNMPVRHQDKVEDVMDDLGWKYKTVKQARDYLEIEVFTDGDMNTIRRKVRKSLEKSGLAYEPVDTIGQRVVFDRESGK